MNASPRNLVILAVATLSYVNVHSQGYDYPVKPGTEAWKKLKTHDEMIEVTLLPKVIIINIKTDEQLKTKL